MADILSNPVKPWDWYQLSSNPGITTADVLRHPDKPWNWAQHCLSMNPRFTMADVPDPGIPWNHYFLFARKDTLVPEHRKTDKKIYFAIHYN